MSNQSENPAAGQDPRVPLAYERTFLAYERTRIAWVRTALALISFGFLIAKFFAYLREQRGEGVTLMTPRAVGLIMIGLGVCSLIVANWQQHRALKSLRERCPQLPAPAAGILSWMIVFVGILALIGTILQ